MNRLQISTALSIAVVALVALAVTSPLLAEPVQWRAEDGGNDHYYELFSPANGITWTDAAHDAGLVLVKGSRGRLASITSQAEWEYITTTYAYSGTWIGLAYQWDDDDDGLWDWIDGNDVDFTAWLTNPQEPNGEGDYGQYEIRDNVWGWNDRPNETHVSGDPNRPYSYLAEYPYRKGDPTGELTLLVDPVKGEIWVWASLATFNRFQIESGSGTLLAVDLTPALLDSVTATTTHLYAESATTDVVVDDTISLGILYHVHISMYDLAFQYGSEGQPLVYGKVLYIPEPATLLLVGVGGVLLLGRRAA